MLHRSRLRVTAGQLKGEILVDGQRAFFEATLTEYGVQATFDQHPSSEYPLDQRNAFLALERFIEENLRG